MSRLFAVLRRVEEAVLAGGILVIAAVTIANALSRSVLGMSLAFAEETARFAIVVVTFAGLSHAAGLGRHIRMSALSDQLGPRARKALMCVIAALTALLCFAMAFYAARYVATLRTSGTVSPVLQVPFWIPWSVAPVGFFFAGLQYVLAVVRNLREDDVYLSWDTTDAYEEPPP